MPTILLIVGVSGDLSRRKLLPAIGQIAAVGALPDQFKIVGISRRADINIAQLLSKTENSEYIRDHITTFQMDLDSAEGYQELSAYLGQIEKEFGAAAQRLFYLAVPPRISQPIIEFLGSSGLANSAQTKLLLEKPFGVDLESATELVKQIDKYFKPEQVYRIDHYLAKETAQNFIVFRESNSLFKRTWSKDFIESIEIIASEEIGIEGRAAFYEQTGALRDIIQSHLLQLSALVLMRPPLPDKPGSEVPKRRLEALRQIKIEGEVRRGQYEGYRAEAGNPKSTAETFISLKLVSSDPNWTGVPIILTSGKALDRKFTEIKIAYKKEEGYESNELIIRLQPNEAVELCVWAKQPGYEHKVGKHLLKFAFKEHFASLPEAYEQVLFNAINSEHGMFASSEEILETWRIIDPIQRAWAKSSEDLFFYKQGTAAKDL